MKTLSTKGLAMAFGVITGVWVLILGLIVMTTGWGVEILTLYAGVFPGYSATIAGSIIGGILGFVEGYIIGWVTAVVYNKFAN